MGGCTFAMVNVSQNKGIINKSQATKIPIKYVPLILLHIDGKPFMRYDGPHKFQDLKRFVIEIAQKVSKNNKPQSIFKEHPRRVLKFRVIQLVNLKIQDPVIQ